MSLKNDTINNMNHHGGLVSYAVDAHFGMQKAVTPLL